MAKKTTKKTTKTSSEKKERKVDYCPFVKTVVKERVLEFVPFLKEAFNKHSGIEPIDVEDWNKIDEFVVKTSRIAKEMGEDLHIASRTERVKRANYTLTNKVRESDTKRFVLGFIEKLGWSDVTVSEQEHFCYLIFTHLAVMCTENCKVEKEKKDKKVSEEPEI